MRNGGRCQSGNVQLLRTTFERGMTLTEEYLEYNHVKALENWAVDTEAIQGVINLVDANLLHPREARVILGLAEQPAWGTPKTVDKSTTDDG